MLHDIFLTSDNILAMSSGWTGSILYSTGIGLLLKLFSSALQQKMIGENLSHYVKIRQFVGINSTLMKAMRLVLGKKGMSVSKVAILIGGPGKLSFISAHTLIPTQKLTYIVHLCLYSMMKQIGL